jgi:dTDP-glucose pyrophosphorylase
MEPKSGSRKVHDAERFGAAELRDGEVIGIEEKPRVSKSNYPSPGSTYMTTLTQNPKMEQTES